MPLWFCLWLLAQSQAPNPLPEMHRPAENKPGTPVPRAPAAQPRVVVAVKPKVCSIPLINVLPGRQFTNDKIAIPVEPWVRSHFRAGDYVTPPAPPCDD